MPVIELLAITTTGAAKRWSINEMEKKITQNCINQEGSKHPTNKL
jgi:hypothetical protein